jgi:hypothetical protein
MRALSLALALSGAAGAIVSVTLAVIDSGQPALAGAPLHVAYTATLTPGDAANATAARLVPYFDGEQYGAEVGFTSLNGSVAQGTAWLAVPWARVPPSTLQLAAQGPFGDGATMGAPPPAGAVLSNAVPLALQPRAPVRPHKPAAGEALYSLAWEPWFTPLNFFWSAVGDGPHGAGLAEAIPAIGRYASVSLAAMRAHAAQFIQAGVDVLLVDWTNNAWDTPTWGDRHPNVQELVNATDLAFGVYAGLRAEGWDVPRFLLLLGLDNGPTTPLPALMGELDYIASAYLGNATAGGVDSFVVYEGRPLVIIFDGSGADHTGFSHPNFTIRWMASQLQSTPSFARRGYWSWMDASLEPVITADPTQPAVAEAVTLAPAFFAAGGWLNAALAAGRSGGLTLLAELANLLGATVGGGHALPRFVNVCQWNEFAGTPEGPNTTTYADSYSPDLSNDLEPTSPWGCGYARPGGVRCGGGWGYRGLNSLAAVRAALVDPAALDGSAELFVVAPAVGTVASYVAPHTVELTFVAARFSAASLRAGGAFLANVSLPVAVAVDGTVVASLAAPSTPGLVALQLDTSGWDARFPHVVTLTALPAPGDAHLTRWPLSFDVVDADAGVPLAQPVPATATAWLWLPESQAPS